MQQQYQPPYHYQPNQVTPYSGIVAKQQQTGFSSISRAPSLIFRWNPQCCCCSPTYSFNHPESDREVGQQIYNMKPTKNIFWCVYNAEITSNQGDILLESTRPLCHCACCRLCCLTRYKLRGETISGLQRLPSLCKNFCFHPGFYVDKDGAEKYWIGKDKKDCCCNCGGEKTKVIDIWNAERTQRIGAIYFIQRAHCCLCCACVCLVYPCLRCLNCENHWYKIVFPEDASEADKALIMGAVSNGAGECESCCFPWMMGK